MTIRWRRLGPGFERDYLFLAFRRLPVDPLGHLEFLGLRHIRKVLEAEVLQEQGRGAVDNGPAHDVPTPDDADEAAFKQGMQHAAAIHTPDLLDLRFRDGLLVGQDGQGFERRLGQLGFFRRFQESLHPGRELRSRAQAEALGHFDDLQGFVAVFLDQFAQEFSDDLDVHVGDALEQKRNVPGSERLACDEQNGFDNLFRFAQVHDEGRILVEFSCFLLIGRIFGHLDGFVRLVDLEERLLARFLHGLQLMFRQSLGSGVRGRYFIFCEFVGSFRFHAFNILFFWLGVIHHAPPLKFGFHRNWTPVAPRRDFP